ncbi:DUF4397 domain-containing protein [Feifania hominis]|uniref:DUF4397 domain-containing protein n=1 Tax=Feifania hominis TaxID=2763660 RepID=A0A926DFE3_9FIRM|nr:DUF4397 domain-containing protein [Feifania hominis]MBC8536846.1 DUF4397 domain-containing protein [Feifania hominis]
MLVSTESSAGATPVIPLPNPGEGGPVDSGGGVPVIPLPNPGEGGPVDSGGGVPVIPLPNPGEGGPVSPGSGQTPCYYCAGSPTGLVRFLNAADGYVPFQIFVNNWRVVRQLGYASLTPYGYVTEGFQTVSVVGQDGYVYLQKPVPFRANDTATIAVINTAGGLDLLQIADATCTRPYGMSCLRMANLAWDSDPLDLLLRDGRTVFRDVRFKEVTSVVRVRPGSYAFYIAETEDNPTPRFQDIDTLERAVRLPLRDIELSFTADIPADTTTTIFVLHRRGSDDDDDLETLVVTDA